MSESIKIIALLNELEKELAMAKDEVAKHLMREAEPHFRPAGFMLVNHEPTFKSRKVARFAKPITLQSNYCRTIATYLADDEIVFGRPYVAANIRDFPIDQLSNLVAHIAKYGFQTRIEDII